MVPIQVHSITLSCRCSVSIVCIACVSKMAHSTACCAHAASYYKTLHYQHILSMVSCFIWNVMHSQCVIPGHDLACKTACCFLVRQNARCHDIYQITAPLPQPLSQPFPPALHATKPLVPFPILHAGPPIKQRAKLVAPFAIFALAYTQIAHLPLEQVLNGAIAAVLFNIIYDTLLSQRLRWFAMCPVIDSMNHQSTSQVWPSYSKGTFVMMNANRMRQLLVLRCNRQTAIL